jgi:hypothetical protein
LEIFDGAVNENDDVVGFSNAGDIRTEDWDEPSEYVRFIRYLQYGKKEDRFFFNMSQHSSTSIGHGTLMRRYANNIDPDSSRVSGELDMYNDYAGFEFVTNSIIDWDLFGGIAFVKPLSFFSDNAMARSLSIGFTYIADRHAPVQLQLVQEETGEYIHPFVIATEHARPRVRSEAFLHAMGIDAEIKVLKTESVDIKPFIDYSWMMPDSPGGGIEEPEGGGGLTLGVLGRFNFGEETVHALRTIAEFRSFSANYLPGYFDIFYEVQKFMANQRYTHYANQTDCTDPGVPVVDKKCLPPTKFYDVFIDRKGDDRHLGFYLEFNYSMVGYMTLTLALEGSDAEEGSHFMAHLEVPAISWLQFFFSFHQRAMQDLGDLFSTDANDKILFAAARLRLLPFLFVNLRYQHTFQILSGWADLDIPDRQYRYYEPAHNYLVDVELGWEF